MASPEFRTPNGQAVPFYKKRMEPRLPCRIPKRWPLTRVEREILLLAADGLTRVQIARARNRSVHTVRAQFRQIHEKLEVQTTAEAVLKAWAKGIIR